MRAGISESTRIPPQLSCLCPERGGGRWVAEMFGYVLAAAHLDLRHSIEDMQARGRPRSRGTPCSVLGGSAATRRRGRAREVSPVPGVKLFS